MNNLALSDFAAAISVHVTLLIYCKELSCLEVDLISEEYHSSVFESEASIIKRGRKINK